MPQGVGYGPPVGGVAPAQQAFGSIGADARAARTTMDDEERLRLLQQLGIGGGLGGTGAGAAPVLAGAPPIQGGRLR